MTSVFKGTFITLPISRKLESSLNRSSSLYIEVKSVVGFLSLTEREHQVFVAYKYRLIDFLTLFTYYLFLSLKEDNSSIRVQLFPEYKIVKPFIIKDLLLRKREIEYLSYFILAILIVLIIAINIIKKIYPKVYKKDIRSSSSNIR